ncbi:hypothetical protein DNC80_14045 [Flavobacterium sp. SOK18b]|uniref:restriction endonuclease subunit S n=1 Tax=Flavobacterium sp. SOK18b TaxID=797900 RepID=UPI0015F9280F|nr:restriction endonuclease subunit S [Flavobacterium sp. SOK18b]MBB1194787.1 hypothetical protein [Flavobacterium sp. SOK18b]
METLQPKLRFPEFEGTWEFKSLREITSLITKGTTPKTFSENGVNFIKIECLNGHNIDTSKCLFIDEKTHNKELKRSILQENDLLFAIAGATIGKCTTVKKEALPANTNQALAIIRLKEKENKDYIFQILTSECMSKYIKDNISVGAQPNLNLEQINSFSFSYPSHEEQTRIANFLSSVDEKLNLLKEKKALLEDYKKGIMQKIFNQEIRFKDDNGNDFEEWQEKTIAKICTKIQSGGTPKSTNKDYYDGNIPFLSIADMTKQGKYIEYTSNSISEYGLKNSSSWIVPVNSIIYSMYASVGFVAINKIPIATSQAVLNLILEQDICVDYIYYFLLDFQKYLAEYITTGTQGNLNAQTVKGFVVPIPSSEEQTKIANFLSAIDEKIALVSNQIQDTQEYKKGLLQQMFV